MSCAYTVACVPAGTGTSHCHVKVFFILHVLQLLAVLSGCSGIANPTSEKALDCDVLIFGLFQNCSNSIYNSKVDDNLHQDCCDKAAQANSLYCYCEPGRVKAANTVGVTPKMIEGSLVVKCNIPQDNVNIFGVQGCNQNQGSSTHHSDQNQGSSTHHSGNIAWPLIGGVAGAILATALACGVFWQRRRIWRSEASETFEGLTVYPYSRLEAATSRFRDCLGEGASAIVYSAVLDGRAVAVKRLKMDSGDTGDSGLIASRIFSNEAKGLGRLQHRNLVRLLGYSAEVGRPHMLVYEYIPGGALDTMLYDSEAMNCIPFVQRIAIALGIARGVEYCHHSIESPVVHRDLKPGNILMTSYGEDGVPKISDFGLARIVDAGREATREFQPNQLPYSAPLSADEVLDIFPVPNSFNSFNSFNNLHPSTDSSISLSLHNAAVAVAVAPCHSSESVDAGPSPSCASSDLSAMQNRMMVSESYRGGTETTVVGTFGYIDPEYRDTGQPTLKSDVYSFGIMLLELVLGQPPSIILETLAGRSLRTNSGQFTHVGMAECLLALLAQGEEVAAAKVRECLGESYLPSRPCFQVLSIASLCVQERGKHRPSMRALVRMLEVLYDSILNPVEPVHDDKMVVTVI